jgi:hypothetical protein
MPANILIKLKPASTKNKLKNRIIYLFEEMFAGLNRFTAFEHLKNRQPIGNYDAWLTTNRFVLKF